MFTIVVFERDSRRILFVINSATGGTLGSGSCPIIKRDDVDYEIFTNREPVFYDDEAGQICLKDNCWIINSDVLQGLDSTN